MFNQRFHHEHPDVEDNVVHQFKASYFETVQEQITGVDGKVLSTRNVKKPVQKIIPASQFENRELSCDLFSVENQKAAGIDLFKMQPNGVRLFVPSLDDKSAVMDSLNEFDPAQLTVEDFETPNE